MFVGYTRNLASHIKRGRELEKDLEESLVTFVHSNPWHDEELAACFQRGRPGLLVDMACHDLALAVAFWGLTADHYVELEIDRSRTLRATRGGVTDFVRVAFSVRPGAGGPRTKKIGFCIDRQAGAFNGLEIQTGDKTKRFLCGEPPLLYANPLPNLSPHIAVAYESYVEGKRVLFEAAAAAASASGAGGSSLQSQIDLPPGAPTLEDAIEVMRLAHKITAALEAEVPVSDGSGGSL